MNKIRDIQSQKFGRLTVVCPTGKRSKQRGVIWLCRCDCGNLKEVRSDQLISGITKSCGCLQKEMAAINRPSPKHGDSPFRNQARLYIGWVNINQRCSKSEVVKECGNGRNWLCEFVGFFVAIDANSNEFEFIDDRIFAFGDKKSLIM